MNLRSHLLPDFRKPGGLYQMVGIAFPLVLASAGHAINLFADRVMLARYSQEAVSAAFPAGLTSFTLSCFFFGVIGYVNSFVAQYTGADAKNRVGPSVWQAVWLSILGGLLMGTGFFWGDPLFTSLGHAEIVREQEIIYFQILSLGAVIPLMQGALSAFWAGRGKTVCVMVDNLVVTGLNIPLNYILIFGCWGAPEMGIAGAAWGTILAALAGLLIFVVLFFLPGDRKEFGTWPPVFEGSLFKRLLRFGTPNGIQLFLDLLAFNLFVILLGLVGDTDSERIQIQEASTIAFSLNSISFTPMIGVGQAVSVLVGQAVGAGKIADACRAVRTGRTITGVYMLCMAVMFVFFPDPLINLFARTGDPSQMAAMDLSRIFLRFVAAFTFFDGMVIVFSSAVKGAGDTKFAMYANVGLAFLLFVVPCLVSKLLDLPATSYLLILDIYVTALAAVFFVRYVQGKWKKMRVIEDKYAKNAEALP